MMFDIKTAKIRAHENNICRYERLLETHLSEVERQFIERRLLEERSALEALTGRSPSATFHLPRSYDGTAWRSARVAG